MDIVLGAKADGICMVEVTADMIERGRGVDRLVTKDRRRVSRKVREARERLTASAGLHRDFTFDLVKLYAQRRKAAAPGAAIVGLGLAAMAAHWAPIGHVLAWLVLDALAMLFSFALARRFLQAVSRRRIDKWARAFVAAEMFQGTVWSAIVLLTGGLHEPQIAAFVMVALLLVAAMNASVTASLSAAVYGALAPMVFVIIAALHPWDLADLNLLLTCLAFATLLYFVYLANRLRDGSLQALQFRADKEDLITELEQSKANSDLARLRAEESNLAKSRFLATMSHELRTPLNAILGFSEIMKTELFGRHVVSAYRDYAGDIHASGEHLLALINEILDLSRVEAGRYELREESIDLVAIVEECRHLVGLRAQKKRIDLRQDRTGILPRLWADKRAVRQIVLNLLSNAIKFTPPGGRVAIRLTHFADGGLALAIKDTGSGIPDDEIAIVMSSFGRGTFAHKTAEEGTGLGLPIVKGLVDLHGGTFELTSKVREGTEVTVRFPPARVMSVLARIEAGDESAMRSAA